MLGNSLCANLPFVAKSETEIASNSKNDLKKPNYEIFYHLLKIIMIF